MKTYNVTVQYTGSRVYRVHARDEQEAIDKACERCERRDDVDEAGSGRADLVD